MSKSISFNPVQEESVNGFKLFQHLYNTTLQGLEFDPNWSNGTGYYNDATLLNLDVVTRSYDPTTKRKILLLPTKVGTVALFERYTHGDRDIIVSNSPTGIYGANGMVTQELMLFFCALYKEYTGKELTMPSDQPMPLHVESKIIESIFQDGKLTSRYVK